MYAIELTKAAVAKVTDLLRREEPGLALQVSVQPGGCSGMRYQLFFTDKYAKVLSKMLDERDDEGFAEEDDPQTAAQRAALDAAKMSVVWFDRFAMVIDPKSGPYLQGASIDYLDTLQKSGFVIDNPNASGSCACGDSFQ
ncbi:iron-sulfur cluster biosynthesis family protein [Streptomyces sp. ME02-6987-2C]|uniref:HesB/IscA family protein n=1 Tax=unclassified Streptomyces TaxID=2593676 RepID=UPI0029B34B66|nr:MULTISPECIES: iron-sulfur cluster biosynthesis family protein [unclassified Streptomyces]MDX3372595.1 iron-sulfur cluster biosynthesis family protein [Streptomyces sp. ME02-6987-2C]MDX3427286.1 iron-sulfur cluster biosynthesis family protein [Streptomyces sp. ME02-6985-2c]